MSQWVVWTVVALAMAGLELLTGTFYLIVLSLSAACGAVAAFAGASIVVQVSVFAVCSVVGCPCVYFYRKHLYAASEESDSLQNIDEGNTVVIDAFDENRLAKVLYRGAPWTAQAAQDSGTKPGTYRILKVDGSRLIVKGPI